MAFEYITHLCDAHGTRFDLILNDDGSEWLETTPFVTNLRPDNMIRIDGIWYCPECFDYKNGNYYYSNPKQYYEFMKFCIKVGIIWQVK